MSGSFSRLLGSLAKRRNGWLATQSVRTGLQQNSLQTGNFSGKFAIYSLWDALLKAEVTVLQRFLDNSLLELTGKIF